MARECRLQLRGFREQQRALVLVLLFALLALQKVGLDGCVGLDSTLRGVRDGLLQLDAMIDDVRAEGDLADGIEDVLVANRLDELALRDLPVEMRIDGDVAELMQGGVTILLYFVYPAPLVAFAGVAAKALF